jgi:hypothetical protein
LGITIWKLDNLNSTGQPVQYSLGNSGLKTNFEYDTKGFVSKITTGIGVHMQNNIHMMPACPSEAKRRRGEEEGILGVISKFT